MPRIDFPYQQRTVAEWISRLKQSHAAEERLQALQAIGAVGTPDDIAANVPEALNDADATVRALAARWMGKIAIPLPDTAGMRLYELLADSDPDARFEAARALVLKHPAPPLAVVPALVAFLDEPETQPLMASAVIDCLTRLELEPAQIESDLRPRLFQWLEHDRGEVREAVAVAIARWPALVQNQTAKLLPLLDDPEPVVREKIAAALGLFGQSSPDILAALAVAAQDEDAEVARVAKDAIQTLQSTTQQ